MKIPQGVIDDSVKILCCRFWQSLAAGRENHTRNKRLIGFVHQQHLRDSFVISRQLTETDIRFG